VVVRAGETVVDAPVTVPIPLIESAVEPETDQERVEDCPAVITDGLAVNEEMVGTGLFTVTEIGADVAALFDRSLAIAVSV
jgi:hypothetical protein